MYGINVTNLLEQAKIQHGAPQVRRRGLRRQLEEEVPATLRDTDDFLLLYGGKVPGKFKGSTEESEMDYTAKWNRQFFVIKAANSTGIPSAPSGTSNPADDNDRFSGFHPIFVEEPVNAGAAKTIKIVYFADYNNKIREVRP